MRSQEFVTELVTGTGNKEHLINRVNKVADICATMGDKPLLYREVRNTRGMYGDKALIIKATPTPKTVIFTWFAPNPKPVEITKNKYINSSGSLMAALNLTMDKAPTKPNDKAKEDLTIVITKHVVIPGTTKFLEK